MKETAFNIYIEKAGKEAENGVGAGENRETEALTIEEAFKQLEQLLARLENGEVPLEQSFDLYQQGMKLVRLCGQKIDRVEKQLIVLDEREDRDGF